MESAGPRLSSLASMPRLHYNSAEVPDSIAPVQALRELAGRAVYPVTLKLELDQKALVGCRANQIACIEELQSNTPGDAGNRGVSISFYTAPA